MANRLFEWGRECFASASNASPGCDWVADTIKLSFWDVTPGTGGSQPDTGSATPQASWGDRYYGDLGGGEVAVSAAFTNKNEADRPAGTLDAADVTVTGVLPPASGQAFENVLIWKDSGSPNTSPLLILIDSATGLPTTAADGGSNIEVIWDNGANRIAKL